MYGYTYITGRLEMGKWYAGNPLRKQADTMQSVLTMSCYQPT